MKNTAKTSIIISAIAFMLAGCNAGSKPKKRHSSSEQPTSGISTNTSESPTTVTTAPSTSCSGEILGPVSGKPIETSGQNEGRIKGTTYVYDFPVGNYYDFVGDQSGDDLLNLLATTNTQRRKPYGYIVGMAKYCDNFGEDNAFYTVYTHAKYTGKIPSVDVVNREHMWPASRTINGRDEETDPIEQDVLQYRPARVADNNQRGNKFYGYSGGTFDPGYQIPAVRGEAARIILYCAIADTRLGLVDKDDDNTSNHTMGRLSTLLQWNLDYPVQDYELYRNSGSQHLQGNRNPFVDHPEYACRIWGSKFPSICK